MTVEATLCHIVGRRGLLLKKASRGFSRGKWNAPGGKLQPKETAERCATREVYEETGLKVQRLRKVGTLVFFKYNKREDPDWIAHVFLTNKFYGTIKESREGILRWYPIEQPPFDEMWEDDKYWYRHAVEGRSFRGDFYFRGDFEKLVDHKIELL